MSGTLIIGGGAIGLSVAYHLGCRGARDVVLLERNRLTSGTSWHAAGIVGPLRATPNLTRLASYALELFPRLERETGMATGYRQTGGYWLAREPDRLDELRRIADVGTALGLSPRMVAASDVRVPGLDCTGLAGALEVPEDGQVNPVDLCMAYARAAKDRGIELREAAPVVRLLAEDGRITGAELAGGRVLRAETVILCAGAWSRSLAETVGAKLPLQAVEHMYVVTEPMAGLPDPMPVVRDLDRGIYIKGDAGKLVIGGFERDAKCWDADGPEGDRAFLELPEDWSQFAPFMEAALSLVPGLATTGIQRFMNGPESFTADTRPLIGPSPEIDGLYIAAGMNSVGVMSSAGIGRLLADWVSDPEAPRDAWEVDIARADPRTAEPEHMAARMQEAVADLFAMHWPYKQPAAGRGLRVSALHDCWAEAGAVFGLTAGWERGLWYARAPEERSLPYATAAQPWWPIAAREAAEMAERAVMLDLSPFSGFDLGGRDVLAALNRLTTAEMDMPAGRAVYTQVLNAAGGIEMDVTISRLGPARFHLTSGAASRARDRAFLRRKLPGCTVEDVTETRCIIGVMGAGSASVLQQLCPDAAWSSAPLGTVAEHELAGCRCRTTRLSYVGEWGWELSAAAGEAPRLFGALRALGTAPMGHFALDGCRMEKGFRHWGHDIGPTITPLEAGLGFTIDWTKDFTGKAALMAQREAGLRRRLVLLRVEGAPLLLHDEPVFERGALVGLTTSGARGPRTGLDLALAAISVAPGETPGETAERCLKVRVAGQDHPARALSRPPFDPDGKRMRG